MTPSTVTFYGADWCSDCRRSKRLLDRLGIHYAYLDVAADQWAADQAQQLSGRQSIPVIALPNGVLMVEPSDLQLSQELERAGLTAA